MKLVTGPQAAREKEIEIRLVQSGFMIQVHLFENGTKVIGGYLGSFVVSEGKIEFVRAFDPSAELVHVVNREIRCV